LSLALLLTHFFLTLWLFQFISPLTAYLVHVGSPIIFISLPSYILFFSFLSFLFIFFFIFHTLNLTTKYPLS
jgi:hypothetical protein